MLVEPPGWSDASPRWPTDRGAIDERPSGASQGSLLLAQAEEVLAFVRPRHVTQYLLVTFSGGVVIEPYAPQPF
jgi:hypothetical protein